MVGESFLTHLEGCFIPDTSSVYLGPFCFRFGKSCNFKNRFCKIDSEPFPSYNMLEMTMGSFHGFGKKYMLSWHVRVKTRCFCISLFLMLFVKV